MFLLLDIGGTNVRLAVSADAASFAEPAIVPTPRKFREAISVITATARQLSTDQFESVIVGLPGPLDAAKSKTMGGHKLPDWKNQPLKHELEQALQAPVTIENDTALAGLGEATVGAGRGYAIVAYHTISTGVGGVRVVDGRIDRNALGFEPGWQVIDADNTLLPSASPLPQRLEHLVGGAEVEKRFGQSPKSINDIAVWDELARWLAVALNNTLVYWSPDVIILGGPMMNDIPLDTVRRETASIASFLPHLPPIEVASLGKLGGLHGGLAFIKYHHPENKE